jgi:hypothetical protein
MSRHAIKKLVALFNRQGRAWRVSTPLVPLVRSLELTLLYPLFGSTMLLSHSGYMSSIAQQRPGAKHCLFDSGVALSSTFIAL